MLACLRSLISAVRTDGFVITINISSETKEMEKGISTLVLKEIDLWIILRSFKSKSYGSPSES